MTRGIKDKVAIVGFGATTGGELWRTGADDLMVEAASEALQDAGLEVKDIQAAWAGGRGYGVAQALKMGSAPVSKIDNGWASGADAVRTAVMAVAAGAYDIVMAAGSEKFKDEGGPPPLRSLLLDTDNFPWTSTSAMAAPFAVRYMHRWGYSDDQLKQALGHIAIKNRRNGARNPKATLQQSITLDQYLEAPVLAWPLSALDCSPIVDGASACIITTPAIARQLKSDYALVKGLGAATIDGWNDLSQKYDACSLPMNTAACRAAYEMAGIKDPVREIDEYNVHDASTITELLCYESLELCPAGQAPQYIEAGLFDTEGELPVNTDGGVISVGQHGGTVGLRILHEPYVQVTGRAGQRQIKNMRLAAAHSQGAPDAVSSIVLILGARD